MVWDEPDRARGRGEYNLDERGEAINKMNEKRGNPGEFHREIEGGPLVVAGEDLVVDHFLVEVFL